MMRRAALTLFVITCCMQALSAEENEASDAASPDMLGDDDTFADDPDPDNMPMDMYEPDSHGQLVLLDVDISGTLTANELIPSFLHSVQWLGTAQEAMDEMDTDKNGHADLEELLAWASPRVERYHSNADFSAADTNSNGFLTLREYKNTGHASSMLPEGKDEQVHQQDLFKSLDTDHDGKVSEAEYMILNGLDTFSQMDADKNGQTSLDEWSAYWTRIEPGVHDKETDAISFKELDRNKDDFINRTEYKHIESAFEDEVNGMDISKAQEQDL